jgi:hypothetical protein
MWKKGQQGSGWALGAWKPGQSGYVPGGAKRGVKLGSKRGKYKTKRAQEQLDQEMHPEKKPPLKVVGKEQLLSTRDYLESVYASESLPHNTRMAAAATLHPFNEARAEGHRSKLDIGPPPKTMDAAIEYSAKILELQNLGVITDKEAASLREGVTHLAQLLGWHDLQKRIEALEAKHVAAGNIAAVQVQVTTELPTLEYGEDDGEPLILDKTQKAEPDGGSATGQPSGQDGNDAREGTDKG